MIVDRVSSALMPSSHFYSNSDKDMSDSEEDIIESSEGEDLMEPDDSMILVQYQSSHRKKALS